MAALAEPHRDRTLLLPAHRDEKLTWLWAIASLRAWSFTAALNDSTCPITWASSEETRVSVSSWLRMSSRLFAPRMSSSDEPPVVV